LALSYSFLCYRVQYVDWILKIGKAE
jgi:hypothetical protein